MTSSLRDIFDLACPQCGNADKLEIAITCIAELTIDGTEPLGDHDWDDASPCRCPDCGHGGQVAHFRCPQSQNCKERKHP
jgi:hypothetical protein